VNVINSDINDPV